MMHRSRRSANGTIAALRREWRISSSFWNNSNPQGFCGFPAIRYLYAVFASRHAKACISGSFPARYGVVKSECQPKVTP
jgi:hypothetical protein